MNWVVKDMNQMLIPLVAGVVLVAGPVTTARAAQTSAATAASADSKSSNLFGNVILAKGKGVEVKRSQLDEEIVRVKSQAAANGRPIPADQTTMMEQQILDQLINVQILQGKATEADKAAGKAAAEKRLVEVKSKLGTEEAFKRQLTLMGATEDEVLRKWGDALTAESVLKRELKINITDADARKYYDDNPSRFEQPEMVRASHILLSTRDSVTGTELPDDKKAAKRKQIEDLLKRARAGEDFAKLAQEHSEDPGSKDKGGEYKFPRGQMVPEFEAAAFSLKTNQISDVVTTSFGYHIIKLSEKIPAEKVDYAKAEANLKEGLAAQAMQKQFPEYIKGLRKEAAVEILDEKLKLPERPDASGLPAGHPPVQPAK